MIGKKIFLTVISALLCVAFVFGLVGCTNLNNSSKIKKNDPTEMYMDYGQDAAQYTTFLDKEIMPVTNYLMSNMTLIRSLEAENSRNTTTEDSALRTAQNDLKEIKKIYNRIYKMPAGKGYESNKERALKIIRDIKKNFKGYIALLKTMKKVYSGYSGLEPYQQAFSDLYIELTDTFTNYYK